MAMKTTHIALTLRGDHVEDGIEVDGVQIPFTPEWGMTRETSPLLAAASYGGTLDTVQVAIATHGPVLAPCEGTPQRELVLVQQYKTGSGAKRWPSFYVETGSEVRKLSEAATSGGSGQETWELVSAPLGWAQNIASQFINERDYGSQIISYKPGNSGKKESDLPSELLTAFRGDEEATRLFMTRVNDLPTSRLDSHIIHNCGRRRVKAHLEDVSGDPDFFMDADPNRVVGYVAQVHYPSSNPKSTSDGNATVDDLRHKWGCP